MKIGEKYRTARGEFEVRFSSCQEAEAAGYEIWFIVWENNEPVAYTFTKVVEKDWCEVVIALA